MFLPRLSFPGAHRTLRIVGLSALLFGASTSVLMAANPGCQVALRFETLRVSTAVKRKTRHSAATLARWKAGAAAWSKAHSGRIYRGQPPVQTATAGKSAPYACRDIALAANAIWPMLLDEPLPEFHAYSSDREQEETPAVNVALASNAPAERDQMLGGFYGMPSGGGAVSSGGGASPNGPVSSSTVPPAGLEAAPHHSRLSAPGHPTQEVTLTPDSLPPPVTAPTPEPSAVVLLGSGIVALGFCKLWRRPAY